MTKKLNQSFIMVPTDKIFRIGEDLGPGCVTVYVMLLSFARQDGACYPSKILLAKLTGTSLRSLSNHIKRLENAGYLDVKRNRTNKLGRKTNLYLIQEFVQTNTTNQGKTGANTADENKQILPMGTTRSANTAHQDEIRSAKSAGEYRQNLPTEVEALEIEAVIEQSPPANKEEYISTRKSAVGKNADCSLARSAVFLVDDEIEVKKKKPYPEKAAQLLFDSLTSHRKIMRRPNLNKWKKTIQTFFDECIVDLTEDAFDKTLRWYCNNIGGNYIPLAFSATSFCDKYVHIEHQMNLSEKKQKDDELKEINNDQYSRLMDRIDARNAAK